MKEDNYEKLRRALDQLPAYDPPEGSWEQIDRSLQAAATAANDLSETLPAYTPPTKVWNKLSHDLDKQGGRRRRMRVVYRWAASAAAIVLIFAAGYTFANYDNGPKVTYVYAEEAQIDASLVSNDWNDEEESFSRVLAQLAAVDEPELNALRLELEELTAAKKEVEDMLLAYGNDHDIIKQLVEIESERSRVYRRAIAEL